MLPTHSTWFGVICMNSQPKLPLGHMAEILLSTKHYCLQRDKNRTDCFLEALKKYFFKKISNWGCFVSSSSLTRTHFPDICQESKLHSRSREQFSHTINSLRMRDTELWYQKPSAQWVSVWGTPSVLTDIPKHELNRAALHCSFLTIVIPGSESRFYTF